MIFRWEFSRNRCGKARIFSDGFIAKEDGSRAAAWHIEVEFIAITHACARSPCVSPTADRSVGKID